MDDILRFVSLVNWHLTFRLEHSEQLDVSVASHLTFLSRHASQLGSFLLCLYARFCMAVAGPDDPSAARDGPGVFAPDSLEAKDSLPIMDPAAIGAYGWKCPG